MGYERNERGSWRNDDYRDRDYGRDYGADRDYSSARDYAAAGQFDRGNRDRYANRDQRGDYGNRDSYGSRDYGYRSGDMDRSRNSYGSRDDYGDRDRGNRDYYGGYYGGAAPGDRDNYGQGNRGYGRGGYGEQQRQGGYGRHGGRDDQRGRGYAGQPQGYDYEDRGFFDRAGDEVRSWFGDDEAERRREADRRYDERYANDRDEHYSNWRRERIGELDRDYDEYRRENATKFENEFNSFRTERQTQRSSLSKVEEHMEVIGSDGEHVGTVDKVRGDRIILTKNDVDAGGRHHSIPSRWIDKVEDKVHIRKSAAEAKREWRDEERNQAMFGNENRADQQGSNRHTGASSDTTGTSTGGGTTGNPGRSFSGTY